MKTIGWLSLVGFNIGVGGRLGISTYMDLYETADQAVRYGPHPASQLYKCSREGSVVTVLAVYNGQDEVKRVVKLEQI